MNRTLIIILTVMLMVSCNTNQNSLKSELSTLKTELNRKDEEISALKNSVEILTIMQTQNYKKEIIDQKNFNDTLDISDNFFVYNHVAEISTTSNPEFESIMVNFDQVISEYGNGFFAKVMTFYNGQILPLENGDSKTDLHVLIQSTELGEENKTFVISDFYNVDLKRLEKENNSLILTFEHGKFPRKTEKIIIEMESVKFQKK